MYFSLLYQWLNPGPHKHTTTELYFPSSFYVFNLSQSLAELSRLTSSFQSSYLSRTRRDYWIAGNWILSARAVNVFNCRALSPATETQTQFWRQTQSKQHIGWEESKAPVVAEVWRNVNVQKAKENVSWDIPKRHNFLRHSLLIPFTETQAQKVP